MRTLQGGFGWRRALSHRRCPPSGAVLALVALVAVSCSRAEDGPTPATGDGSQNAAKAGKDDSKGEGDKGPKGGGSRPCAGARPTRVASTPVAMDDITGPAGLVDPLLGMYGHAAATGDVNGDGWLDLFVGTFADKPADRYRLRGATGPAPDRLLLGGPEGFRPSSALADTRGRTSGAALADLDGDGDVDLVAARNVTSKRPEGEDTTVFRNDGGSFADAGRPAPGLAGRGVGVLDYDGDGRLDVFIAGDGGTSVLLRNEGDLKLRNVTTGSGIPADVTGFGVATADLTADGRPDLFVAGSNRLFVNTGGGSFREADASVFRWQRYGEEDLITGVAVGDVNRDGRPDLVVGHHFNSTVDSGCEVPVRLYLHRGTKDGQPQFEDVTDAAGIPSFPTKAPHVELVDFDNDGWLDLLATASAAQGSRPAILRNEGIDSKGVPTFVAPPGLGDDQYWVTGVSADFDRDGRMDVFVVENDPARPSLLLGNRTTGGHWLDVELPPGPGGIGAVVDAYRPGAMGDPAALIARMEVTVSRGYAAGGSATAHIGLGGEARVDLVLRLPRRSEAIRLPGIAVDRRVRFPDDFPAGTG